MFSVTLPCGGVGERGVERVEQKAAKRKNKQGGLTGVLSLFSLVMALVMGGN